MVLSIGHLYTVKHEIQCNTGILFEVSLIAKFLKTTASPPVSITAILRIDSKSLGGISLRGVRALPRTVLRNQSWNKRDILELFVRYAINVLVSLPPWKITALVSCSNLFG